VTASSQTRRPCTFVVDQQAGVGDHDRDVTERPPPWGSKPSGFVPPTAVAYRAGAGERGEHERAAAEDRALLVRHVDPDIAPARHAERCVRSVGGL
jgi:hypothetical protein